MLEGGSALFEWPRSVMPTHGSCPWFARASARPAKADRDIGVYNERLIGVVIDLHQSLRREFWWARTGQSAVVRDVVLLTRNNKFGCR
jgi:hypothetical protein